MNPKLHSHFTDETEAPKGSLINQPEVIASK